MRETEVKFAVHGSFTLPDFDGEAPVAEVVQLPDLELKATYYDTPDLRLARSGVTLRYRTGEGEASGWHLKLPVDGDGGRTREEVHLEGPQRPIPRRVEELVTAYARTERLAPVEAMHTKRRGWALNDAEGQTLAELVDDEVSVLQKGRVTTRFRELELEKRDAKTKTFEQLVAQLQAAGAREAEPIPKVVRVLGPRATAPADLPPVPALDKSSSGADLLRSALTRGLHRLIENDPQTRLGDVEGVHQMRVGARRLRSDLRTFEILVDPEWSGPLIEELRWLGESLGRVRDLDVLQERLGRSAEGSGSALIPLFNRLSEEHDAARDALEEDLRSERYKNLLEALIEATRLPQLTEVADSSARDLAPRVVAPRWKKLRKAVRELDRQSTDEQLHKVRIKAKRARYAAEAVAPALNATEAKAAERFASGAEEIQEVLGKLQDAAVARETITRCLTDAGKDPVLHFAAGRLYEKESRSAETERASFEKAWENLDRRRNLSWLQNA